MVYSVRNEDMKENFKEKDAYLKKLLILTIVLYQTKGKSRYRTFCIYSR